MSLCTIIQQHVASYYGLTMAELLSERRSARIARPRQVAMFLCSELTGHSLPKVGRAFFRDHTTVMHANKMTKRRMAEDADTAHDVLTLLARTAPEAVAYKGLPEAIEDTCEHLSKKVERLRESLIATARTDPGRVLSILSSLENPR